MNFIAASLLYHAEEYIAFWLLVMLFEMFELRDIYLPSKTESLDVNKSFRITRADEALSNY